MTGDPYNTINSGNNIANEINALKAHVHPPVPNPAPLGLIAFGLTTTLLQMKHTQIAGEEEEDLDGVDTVTLGFALFFGGLVQLIAGLSEIRRNNLFGFTAFCIYGGFWMSVATIEIVTLLATNAPPPLNEKAMQSMLFMLSVITFMLWSLTFKINKTLCSLFFLLGVTCMLLSFGVRNEASDIIGGYFGIITSLNAFWLAFAELFNDVYGEGEEIIPLGHWQSNKFRKSGGVHAPGRIQSTSPSIIQRHVPKILPTVPPSLEIVPEEFEDASV